jgi:hypothetical protein
MKEYKSLQEFWPYYLVEHSNLWNRRLHFIGSLIALILFTLTFVFNNYYFLLAAFVSGYFFAWIGHFFIEKNKPTTFQYPIKSFFSDWIMFVCILTGKIDSEMKKAKLIINPTLKDSTPNSPKKKVKQ